MPVVPPLEKLTHAPHNQKGKTEGRFTQESA
jgi:hypothetical protein